MGRILSQRSKKCTSFFWAPRQGGTATGSDGHDVSRLRIPGPHVRAGARRREDGARRLRPGPGSHRQPARPRDDGDLADGGECGFTHARPDYGIRTVMVGNREVAVTEEVTHRTPFGTLLHFRKDTDIVQPKVLLVAPLSGHFATLLRNTAKTLLQDHDVFITDWHSARDIPGRPGASASTNMSSTSSTSCMCWARHPHRRGVPALRAGAGGGLGDGAGGRSRPAAQPDADGGPVDVRINPTKVNELPSSIPTSGSSGTSSTRSRCPAPARAGGSIRGSCRSSPSCR